MFQIGHSRVGPSFTVYTARPATRNMSGYLRRWTRKRVENKRGRRAIGSEKELALVGPSALFGEGGHETPGRRLTRPRRLYVYLRVDTLLIERTYKVKCWILEGCAIATLIVLMFAGHMVHSTRL